jgi:asparagine synthase (glutamine-hydrolysing)
MQNGKESLAFGEPIFREARLAECARDRGSIAAWREALANDARSAAAGAEGGFAVGLREPSGRSFAAVDRFGIESMCYRVKDGLLEFSSRADELSDAAGAIDLQAVYDYLYFHAIPSPRTIFKGVFRVPPGHYVLLEQGRLTVAPYWVPRFDEDRSTPLETLGEEFRRLLRLAVERQLDGSTPACFLSGGTDSSTIAGITAQIAGHPPSTYSIGFEAEGYDEMAYARIAARHFKTRHHEYYVTPDDLVRGIPQLAAHFDQPFGNSSVLPAFFCALKAREDGVTKMLAGDGGDELFGGNSRYATQRVFDWYALVPKAIRKGVLEPVFEHPAMARLPLLRKGVGYIKQARMPMPDRMQIYNLLQRLGPETVLTEAFLAQVDRADPVRQQRQVWVQAVTSSQVNRTLAYDWRYTLADSDLPKVRAATQLAGVQVGFPLLDDGLLKFSLRLRSDYKLKGLKLRWFFKNALRDFLPQDIIKKKKHGFGLPFGVWVTRHGDLRDLAFDSVNSLAKRNIVRSDFIDALLSTRLAEHPAYYGEMVWILMMLEQWLQRTTATGTFRL